MGKWIALGVVLLIVLMGGGCAVASYNGLNAKSQAVDAQWGQVENVYQRRADLVPNLVATVKGYAFHEREVLEHVTASRAQVGSVQASPDLLNKPAEFQKFQAAQASLSGALSRLLLVVERYPDLKANQNFLALQEELTGTEGYAALQRATDSRYEPIYRLTQRLELPPHPSTSSG